MSRICAGLVSVSVLFLCVPVFSTLDLDQILTLFRVCFGLWQVWQASKFEVVVLIAWSVGC